jgi:hypothetical protein
MNRGNKKQGRRPPQASAKSRAQINQLKQLVMAELRATGGATQRSRARLAPKGPKTGLSRRGARGNGLLSRGDQLTAKGNPRNSQAAGNKQRLVVQESEYIGEITPSAYPAFSLQQYAVNPGQAGTFPWLSTIARNFEKYEFEALAFVYKREVSEYAANGQTGKVIMSFDTDASDPAPANKQAMEDTDPHCDCMPSENMRLVVPQAMLKQFKDAMYVRPGAQPANTDIKTYDLGNLFVACQGTAANTAVGELHVEYRLRLMIPVLEAAAAFVPSAVSLAISQGVGTMTATNPTVANPLAGGVAAGGIVIAQAGTAVTFSNLIVGVEYAVTYGENAIGATCEVGWGTLVGWTSKTLLWGDGVLAVETFVATATTASAVLTITGNMTAVTAALLVITAIPTSTL